MKLSKWAESQGISYRTAWRMWKSGRLPFPAEQLPTGTVVLHPEKSQKGVALYARVSSHDQKADLDRQLGRLAAYASDQKLTVIESVKEVGSGLNGSRKGLLKLIGNPDISCIVVEHRDRLMRFGFEYLESSLAAQNRKIIVIENDEVSDDVTRDLHEVIVSLCARLYGKRSARNRAKKAMSALEEGSDE